MSTFRPNTKGRVCTLNFDDKFIFEIPLHEDTARSIAKIAEKQIEKVQRINPEDENAVDLIYDSSLDAIDEVLGEGAGAKIMSIYERPSLFDVAEVITYISETYSEEYKKLLDAHKKAGNVLPQNGRRINAVR